MFMYEGTKGEDSVNEEAWVVDVAVFGYGEPNMVNRHESIVVWAVDRNEAAEKARCFATVHINEWVKVIRVSKKRG